MNYGRYFEELQPGATFRHWPGSTINEHDDTLMSLLCMNQHPVHIDEHYARGRQHGRRQISGPTVVSFVVGMTQADVGGRAVMAGPTIKAVAGRRAVAQVVTQCSVPA